MGFGPFSAAGYSFDPAERLLLPGFGASLAYFGTSALLRDLQQGMMARLAEVLRLREVLMAAVCPAPVVQVAASPALFPPGDAARQLTVAEYRAAESQPAPPAPPVAHHQSSTPSVAPRQGATLALLAWFQQHRFLRADPVDQGEPSVALLLPWEAHHGKPFPCRTSDVAGRLNTFSWKLMDAVELDSELSKWLTNKRKDYPGVGLAQSPSPPVGPPD